MMCYDSYNGLDRFPSNCWSKGLGKVKSMLLLTSSCFNPGFMLWAYCRSARFELKKPHCCYGSNIGRAQNRSPFLISENRFFFTVDSTNPLQIFNSLFIGKWLGFLMNC